MVADQQEVVITGIAGKFPECFTVDELKEKLFSKSILVKPDEVRKLPIDNEKIKLTAGRIPEWQKFDTTFFGISKSLQKSIEPMLPMMLEKTFEAILDAGYNPYSLKGRNIAVFSAPAPSDTESIRGSYTGFWEGSGMVGTSRAMTANRISFCFNFTGPSVSVEGSWVTSMVCLERAVEMVSSGTVEAAVVAAANNMMYHNFDIGYHGMGLLSEDGVCQPFDDKGHGFVRSEAALAFFIQRRRDAKRIYGSVKKVQSSFIGAKNCGLLQIDPHIDRFLRNFYHNISERPEDVSYIEAHGMCTKEADEKELNALADVFCSHRNVPQLIGTISGNVGNTDNCSGMVSTVKAILAMETGVIPPTVNYHTPNSNVPALVSGKLKEADEKELNALADVFCSHRNVPQLIGTISGNVGNTDNCSGMVSTVKAILAMETGVIPPTVNYHTPNSNVPALVSGKLKPVTEETALPGDLVAVNNLTPYGGFSHILLKRHNKVKKALGPKELPEDGLPRLVLLQGRHEEGVKAACKKVSSMAVDVEFVSLVNDAFKTQIPNYLYKGYTVIPTPQEKPITKIQQLNPTKRPLWFVFSGMGSQWTGMGIELLKIPVFKSTIKKCDKVLRPKGIDIVDILSSKDTTIFDNILNSFVGITAVQIGLVDVLTKLNVTPDGIIGHSVGELGCAYADGCFTAEETILAAYCRGKASLDSLDNDYIKGMMAAVGIGYNDIKDKLPESIDVACHNSRGSCTLSGPTGDINTFVDKLKSDGVFARAVSAGGIAYHSRYIKAIAPKLLKLLEELVPNPRPRSSKWISTSVPEAQWNTDSAKLCSPEYLTNNLLNPVYFEEGCKHLPEDAILIEIAPHGLLQAILRRSVNTKSLNVSLTNRGAGSNFHHLLESLGELYLNNVSIDINALYPKVDYPVSRGTPSLASLASWDHEDDHYQEFISIFNMLYYNKETHEKASSVHSTCPEFKFWKDHRVNGQVVLSPAQVLMYPWQMILTSKRLKIEQHYTVMEDVTISGNVTVTELGRTLYTTCSPSALKFEVSILNDVTTSGTNILSGKFMTPEAKPQPLVVPKTSEELTTMQEFSETEIYLMLSELGCDLGPQFQNIKTIFIGKKECVAKVNWNKNMITFLDSLMKIAVIFKSREKGKLLYPNSFIKLSVDGPFLSTLPSETEVEVLYQSWCNRIICKGAELLGLSLGPAILSDPSPVVWSEFKFQPYFDTNISVEEFLSCCVQTAAEDGFRCWRDDLCKMNILVINTDHNSSAHYKNIFSNTFTVQSNVEVKISQVDLEAAKKQVSQAGQGGVLVVGEYKSLASLVGVTDVLYCITHYSNNGSPKYNQALRPISVCQTESGKLALLKKVTSKGEVHIYKTESLEWLRDLRIFLGEVKKNDCPIILVTQNLTPRQVLPALSKEPYAHRTRTVFIQERDAPQFSLSTHFYSSQLSLGLSVNILSGGVWGSLRSTALNLSPCDFNPNSLITSSIENLSVNCVALNTTFFTYHQEPPIKESEVEYLDYCGVLKGQRVMGVAYFEPESNSLRPDPILEWPVPASWTIQDAATVPVLYTIAYYCIYLKADIEKGEYVFVHAGMSPIGQAIISVALQAGANIIASVVDEEEVQLLTEQFPSIKSSQVLVLGKDNINSAVKNQTQGKGVQVVINCLRGNDFQSTIKLAAAWCRIILLAEIRIEDREIIGLYNFFDNKTAFGISLNSIVKCSEKCKRDLKKAVKNGIDQGIVRPLRKRMFRLHNLTNALHNLQTKNVTEKTVLDLKQENQILPLNGYFQCSLDSLHIIAGENGELKFQLAEWLIHHGARKVILLNDQICNGSNYLKRINHIIHRNKCSTVIAPSSCLETVESTQRFLKETLHMGSVSSIFCVCMDENSSQMKNLDSASREVLPGLQQFVSLLGSGTDVCDSRASSGLPACSIQGKHSFESVNKVLPYLFSLITDTQKGAKFFSVSDSLCAKKTPDEIDYFGYLPNSVEDLYAYGECVEPQPTFVEEVTRSPQYSEVKHCMLPVFMIPGLGQYSVKPLLRQLMHPAFCCRLSADNLSLQEIAESLVQDITEIQTRGPYNIVGESWGGALALAVAQILEVQGSQVNLILIQGIPTTAQSRLEALCKKYNADLTTCILNIALNTQVKNTSHSSWSERLAQVLPTLESEVRESVSKAVTTLNHQLKTFQQSKPSDMQQKGDITLIQNKNEPVQDFESLFKIFEKCPKIVTIDANNHSQLLSSFKTASAINEHMAHTWTP